MSPACSRRRRKSTRTRSRAVSPQITPGDAQAVLEQIEDILPVVSVFFELGRENAGVPVQGMRVFRLPEILRHTRLESAAQVIECLDVINDALRHVPPRSRGDDLRG